MIPESIRISLLVMYAQSGKTSIMLNDIIKTTSDDDDEIFIIINPNNKIITTQTKNRANEKNNIKAIEIVSSAKKSDKYRIKKLGNKIKTDNGDFRYNQAIRRKIINTFVVCDNKTRWDDIQEIIEEAEFCNKKINIYIDEADKVLQNEEKLLNIIKENEETNIQIKLMTATPFTWDYKINKFSWIGDRLKENGILDLFQLEQMYGDQYHRLSESKFIIEERDENPIEYVYNHLIENPPKKGDYIMLPAEVNRESHNKMVEKVKGFFDYIVLLNGKDKILIEYGDQGVENSRTSIISNVELKTELEKYSEIYDWRNKRIAIIGHLCLQRGITFTINGKVLTKIILNKFTLLADTIQLLCRICGYKGEEEKTPEIVTTSAIKNHIDIYDDLMEDILTKCIEEVNPKLNTEKIQKMFDFSKKKFIKDKEHSYIPIKLTLIKHEEEIHNKLIKLKGDRITKNSRKKILDLFTNKDNYRIENKNNFSFDVTNYILKTIRSEISDDRRTINFNENFEKNKCISQSCKKGEMTFDMVDKTHTFTKNNKSYKHEKNIIWISVNPK